ncbi:MAG: phage protein Gp36 family protein [Oceanococcaceae bacterium]
MAFDGITEEELKARVGSREIDQLASSDSESEPADRIAAALSDARSEAAQRIRHRWDIGALAVGAETPESLARILADIARFRLYDDAATDEVRYRYEQSIKDLIALAAGKAELYDPDAAVLAAWDAVDEQGSPSAPGVSAPARKLTLTNDLLDARYAL